MTSRSRKTGLAPTWPWSPRTPWHWYPSSTHTNTQGNRIIKISRGQGHTLSIYRFRLPRSRSHDG